MRLSNAQAVARPQPIDRNPTFGSLGYQVAGVAPHTATVRASQLVAANKKLALESVSMYMRRNVAATVASIAETYFLHVLAGGGSVMHAHMQYNTNTVGVETSAFMTQTGAVNVGDTLQLVTSDVSTAGSIDYATFGKFTVFDA